MQGQQDARLCHVLKQAVLHLGEELPQGLQQHEVTEVAVGEGYGLPGSRPSDVRQTEGSCQALQLQRSPPPHPVKAGQDSSSHLTPPKTAQNIHQWQIKKGAASQLQTRTPGKRISLSTFT